MRRLGCTRRILKWLGLVGSLLTVLVWAWSVFYNPFSGITQPGVRWICPPFFTRVWSAYMVFTVGSGELTLRLWAVFLALSIPTVTLWWLDRCRPPPHCCQRCGYDLTGNTSGICPECGAGTMT